MTQTPSIDVRTPDESTPEQGHDGRDGELRGFVIGLIAVAVALVAFAIVVAAWPTSSAEAIEVSGQGGEGTPLAVAGASLARSVDGLTIEVNVPTPPAGSYEYPTADMAPPGATHPEVIPAGSGESEVFTAWAFIFNYPERCTDESCDFDDIGDTAAKGGVFQVDGRIADGASLRLGGAVRLGQPAANGSTLENPTGAEVHVAIAPHGRAHTDADLWAQLNGPLGNPTLWWVATFVSG